MKTKLIDIRINKKGQLQSSFLHKKLDLFEKTISSEYLKLLKFRFLKMSFPEETGNGNENDYPLNVSLPVYNASRESYGNFSDNIPDEDDYFANFSYPGTIKVCAFFSFFLLCVVPESLPSANGVAKVMFSFISVCLSTEWGTM